MDREQLKALIRTAPGKLATLAEIEPELAAVEVHAAVLRAQCDSLRSDLRAIEDAKQQLAAQIAPVSTDTEPARESLDDVVEADKPKPTRAKRTNP